jgi:hypothetical protein
MVSFEQETNRGCARELLPVVPDLAVGTRRDRIPVPVLDLELDSDRGWESAEEMPDSDDAASA